MKPRPPTAEQLLASALQASRRAMLDARLNARTPDFWDGWNVGYGAAQMVTAELLGADPASVQAAQNEHRFLLRRCTQVRNG